jgi:energy-coupling factor transporter ATP-binding protein EcfA2
MGTILPNEPRVLIRNEDIFSNYEKAEAIKSFILEYYNDANNLKNKIMALYGEWGSGKTSVVEHLTRVLSFSESFKTIYFPAWEYEKDDNINMSLFDNIAGEIKDKKKYKEIIKSFLESAYSIVKGVAKSYEINVGLLNFRPGAVLEEYEEYYKKEKAGQKSKFCYQKNLFKQKYIELEKAVVEDDPDRKIIVFIDDLDRCEPEHVLDLLSTIKHFMTLGERTIFFFSLDKKAVEGAVKVKYGDCVIANEYLEKIFDITFSMPHSSQVGTMLKEYFPEYVDQPDKISTLTGFFHRIKFTNPRHLKKVLNKYSITKQLFKKLDGPFPAIIPIGSDILLVEILWLYMIVLYEFYPDKFYEIEDYSTKISQYNKKYYEKFKNEKNIDDDIVKKANDSMRNSFLIRYTLDGRDDSSFNEIKEHLGLRSGMDSSFNFMIPLIIYFTPSSNSLNFIEKDISNGFEMIKIFQYEGNEILIDFCRWFLENDQLIDQTDSSSTIIGLFRMAKLVL